MKPAPLALLLLSCGPGIHGISSRHYFPSDSAPMRSVCGLVYEYDTAPLPPSTYAPSAPWHDWTVQDVQEAEARAIAILGTVPAFRSPEYVCRVLHFPLTVVFTSAPVWVDRWGRNIAGYSVCNSLEPDSFVGLGLGDGGGMVSRIDNPHYGETGWRSTSFAHELAHQLQNCQANPDGLGIDPGFDAMHANWGRSGIAEALKGFYAP